MVDKTIVRFLLGFTCDTFKQNEELLSETVSSHKKISFTFESEDVKTKVEYKTKNIPSIVYTHKLTEAQKENCLWSEFCETWETVDDMPLEEKIDAILTLVYESKLPL